MVSSTLKMEAAGFSETLITHYQITWLHKPEDHSLKVLLLCWPFSLASNKIDILPWILFTLCCAHLDLFVQTSVLSTKDL
jgi:hypothetical protein